MVYTLPAPASTLPEIAAVQRPDRVDSYQKPEQADDLDKPKSFLEVMSTRLAAFQMTPEQMKALKEKGEVDSALLEGLEGVKLSLKDMLSTLKELGGILQDLDASGEITLTDETLTGLENLQNLHVIGRKDDLFSEGFSLESLDLAAIAKDIDAALAELKLQGFALPIETAESLEAVLGETLTDDVEGNGLVTLTVTDLQVAIKRMLRRLDTAITDVKPRFKADPMTLNFDLEAPTVLQEKRNARIMEILQKIDISKLPTAISSEVSDVLQAAQGGDKKALNAIAGQLKALLSGGKAGGFTMDMGAQGQGRKGTQAELSAILAALDNDAALAPNLARATTFQTALQQAVNSHTHLRPQGGAPHSASEQVAVKIRKAVAENAHKINIRLKPANLGSVSIEMSISAQGTVKAKVTAERIETLELLKNDAKHLTSALKAAGMDADTSMMEFQLGGQSDNQQEFLREAKRRLGKNNGARPFAEAFGTESADIIAEYRERHKGLLQIWA